VVLLTLSVGEYIQKPLTDRLLGRGIADVAREVSSSEVSALPCVTSLRTPDNRGGGPIANPDQILGKNPRRSDFFRTKFDFLAKNV
jgi:hypothetical protein